MAEQSSLSNQLWLLEGLEDFRHYSVELLQHSRRHLAILSHNLDENVYASNEFVQALSDLVRGNPHCQVQILIRDTKPAAQTSQPLIRLAQRLPSKIHLRKITQEPSNTDMAYMLGDSRQLLYKNDDKNYRGFYNPDAARELKPLREEFNYLWQYAEPEPEFKQLHI